MASETQKIHFILTGGTIDSYYDGTKDTVVANKKSVIPGYIKDLKLTEEVVFDQICMKDSRHITEKDLIKLLKTVEESPHKRIIITHGTYTMPDTARYLQGNLQRKDQTIILTGSMAPMKGAAVAAPSDGPFNLGYSMSEVQSLPEGIYVCMNGRIFKPNEVLKMLYGGRFTSIYSVK